MGASRLKDPLPRESGHAQISFFQAAAETGARLTGPAKRSGNFAVLLSLAFTFDLEDFGSFCDLLLPISAVDPVCLYVVDEQPHLDERAEPQLGMTTSQCVSSEIAHLTINLLFSGTQHFQRWRSVKHLQVASGFCIL